MDQTSQGSQVGGTDQVSQAVQANGTGRESQVSQGGQVSQTSQVSQGAVRRVLVVDDDADIARLLRVRLERRGFDVRCASDGEEALAALQSDPETHAEVLFLDVSMPRVNGLDVLERVRATGLDVAVIMMTAFGSETVAIEALRRGADDYLRKPLDREEFEAVLERTVSRQLLRRQNLALQQQLEEERRRRDRLEGVLLAARTIEHELGNTLATTVGYAELLTHDPSLTPRSKARAEQALRGARQAAAIIRQMLDQTDLHEVGWGTVGRTTIRLPDSSGAPPGPPLEE